MLTVEELLRMGRVLPTTFAGKLITKRDPFNIPGEQLVANHTPGIAFPGDTFMNQTDRPVEFWRMIARITPLNGASPVAEISPATLIALANPDVDRILMKYIRMRIEQTRGNQKITKAATKMDLLFPRDTLVWDWLEPDTCVVSEGYQIVVDNLAPATFAIGAETCANLNIEINFEGFLLTVSPASESR